MSLRSKLNNIAYLVTPDGDRKIDARLLQYSDRFRVIPHSRVPTDGVIIEGATEVDESMLTGESLPAFKKAGDAMIAGTVNGDGTVIAQLTRLPGRNTVTDIAQLVEDASNSKPKIQDLANKVAGWFIPTMAIITILVLAIWLGSGIGILDYSAGKGIANPITYAVVTLAIACPCALGRAVPMVLLVAGGIAARGGVIIKSANTSDSAWKTTDVIFDKTGTITEDELALIEQVLLGGEEAEAIAMTKALVNGGKHPVSVAVDKYLQQQGVKPLPDIVNI